jgi:MFS family permease
VTIGLFGTAKDFFNSIYQYPGGWFANRLGRRRACLLFLALASIGYLIYLMGKGSIGGLAFWQWLYMDGCGHLSKVSFEPFLNLFSD